jgi:uncharacterized membrane protein
MMFADFNLAFDPAWPWATPLMGPLALIGVALLLIALTIWSYRGVKQANRRRVSIMIALRLAALSLALCMLLRPSIAMTQLEGVDVTKLLVIFDRSASMNVADVEGKSTRFEQVKQLWASRDVQHRLERLAAEQKIEVVAYHGAEDLRPFEPNADATGKRSDMGTWLHQLAQKHGHEKHLRGIAVFGDGADNGTKFSLQDKARSWRGVAAIHAFGVGNPNDPRFKKDIALTSLRVADDKPIAVKAKFALKAVSQAPGFGQAGVPITVTMEALDTKQSPHVAVLVQRFRITQEKDQWIELHGDAPELPGEYKLTVKVEPQAGEANAENNAISTFVHVIKEKINVLWVDRPRVYEPTLAIRLALAPEERFNVRFAMPSMKETKDPIAFYEMGTDKPHYDVIVIGDISAQQFCLGKPQFFDHIKMLVTEKKTGLLMLGGTETFGKGGWNAFPAFTSLLPTKLPDKAEFVTTRVAVMPTKEAKAFRYFMQLLPDDKKNAEMWKEQFQPLFGYAPLGEKFAHSTELLQTEDKQSALVVTKVGTGLTAVFAGDSTSKAWLGSPEAADGYRHFWRQLVYWLSDQQDQQQQLWVTLDKRRINLDLDEPLGFTFGMRGKDGAEVPGVKFEAKVTRFTQDLPVQVTPLAKQQRGTFRGAKETGEHQVVITAPGENVRPAVARFYVVSEDIEMLRPVAEHTTLMRMAEASEGRFHPAEESALLQYLDELSTQVNTESRHKTTHWPDWKRLPASDSTRDQVIGMWQSFSLLALVLFVSLLGGEWLLRRMWGLV